MMYSVDEIVSMYRDSADKAEQIEILADLNACEKREIEDILVRAGFTIPLRKKKKSTRESRWTDKEVERLRRYVEEGLSDIEIGERMGLSKGAISYQVSTRGFTALRHKKKSLGADEIYIKQLEEQLKEKTVEADELKEKTRVLQEELEQREKVCEELRAQLCPTLSERVDDSQNSSILKNVKGLAHLVLCALKSLAAKESPYDDDILDGAVTGVANIIVAIDRNGD